MFKKILIAEDYQSTNYSLEKVIAELQIPQAYYCSYCDDTLKQLQTAQNTSAPFDLLITDLSFEDSENPQKIKSGQELIAVLRKIYPGLKIIVFSSEKREGIIQELFQKHEINAYVQKGRNDLKELKTAIEKTFTHGSYFSNENRHAFQRLNTYEFSNFDTTIIGLLAQGILQKELPEHLQKKNIKPNSLSSIEKRLCLLRESLDVKNNEQLIAFCKDLGII